MKYAGITKNDVVNGQGVCVSVWVQGCPHHCEGCFNPETWDFNGGYDVPNDIKGQVVKALSANGVQRNLSILGGEPLCPENSKLVLEILNAVRSAYPNIKIFLWTGEILSNLLSNKDSVVNSILDKIDVLIDGPFEKENRDFTLALRGSSNQRIYEKNPNGEWVNQSDIYDWKN
jgi:anaerobic ribonucleoside-triphosphate reductase activating protein